MEILKKHLFSILLVGLMFSCADPIEENNENILSGEWVIEEIFVDIDIPPTLIEETEEANPGEFMIPEDLYITQILYSQQDGVFFNDIDFTTEVDVTNVYSIILKDNGLYILEDRDEFGGLNIMEYFFQSATPYFIENYFPEVEIYNDLGDGDYEYYLESYEFSLDYSYFSNSSDGSTTQGIWETVDLGKQILFDYTHPLYEQGSNLWDFEIIDENTVVLTQFGESDPQLSLRYIEESETRIGGVDDGYQLENYYSNIATIYNASIVLSRK